MIRILKTENEDKSCFEQKNDFSLFFILKTQPWFTELLDRINLAPPCNNSITSISIVFLSSYYDLGLIVWKGRVISEGW